MGWTSRWMLMIALGLGSMLAQAPAASAAAATCKGPAPSVGATVRGTVVAVPDSETLCVALGPSPDRWIALKLAGAPPSNPLHGQADHARGALMAVAFARTVSCRVVAAAATARSAVCLLDGRSIVARMREQDAVSVGLAWR